MVMAAHCTVRAHGFQGRLCIEGKMLGFVVDHNSQSIKGMQVQGKDDCHNCDHESGSCSTEEWPCVISVCKWHVWQFIFVGNKQQSHVPQYRDAWVAWSYKMYESI